MSRFQMERNPVSIIIMLQQKNQENLAIYVKLYYIFSTTATFSIIVAEHQKDSNKIKMHLLHSTRRQVPRALRQRQFHRR